MLLTAKALFKAGKFVRCFELLQNQFMLTPSFTVLLFVFGKYVIKAMHQEIITFRKTGSSIDSGFLGAGIGALEECTRTCMSERQDIIQYWIGKAYLLLNMPLKTYQHWILTKNLMSKKKKEVAYFLDEYVFFTRVRDLADSEVAKFKAS